MSILRVGGPFEESHVAGDEASSVSVAGSDEPLFQESGRPTRLGLLREAHEQFATACESVSSRHLEETEVRSGLGKLAKFSRESIDLLGPFIERYGEHKSKDPDRLRKTLFSAARANEFGLLRDLHDLYLMESEIHICLTILFQAGQALRDRELLEACGRMERKNELQKGLLMNQIKHRAPHALVIPF